MLIEVLDCLCIKFGIICRNYGSRISSIHFNRVLTLMVKKHGSDGPKIAFSICSKKLCKAFLKYFLANIVPDEIKVNNI